MRNEEELNVNATTRHAQRAALRHNNGNGMQETLDTPTLLSRLLLPRGGTQRMTVETKGVFLPYPLLTIIVTVAIVVISGLAALEIQVSSLNTTLLLRDADTRSAQAAAKEKLDQLEVYIHDDREKLVRIDERLNNGQPQQKRK